MAGILDSESLWIFRYHCVKGGIREPLAKRRCWRHLANSIALAEVPASYDCFLVHNQFSEILKGVTPKTGVKRVQNLTRFRVTSKICDFG